MKDIKNYINESKDSSVEATKNLIDAIKVWYNAGLNEEGKKSNSPYVKVFKEQIYSFIQECVLGPDMDENLKDTIYDFYNIKDETYEECAKHLIESYILK